MDYNALITGANDQVQNNGYIRAVYGPDNPWTNPVINRISGQTRLEVVRLAGNMCMIVLSREESHVVQRAIAMVTVAIVILTPMN